MIDTFFWDWKQLESNFKFFFNNFLREVVDFLCPKTPWSVSWEKKISVRIAESNIFPWIPDLYDLRLLP